MPAYPTHSFFSHLALLALLENRHPLADLAWQHQGMFRVAGIAGCDIQCMPYQVCSRCQAPYRHNQADDRICLVCSEEGLEDFVVEISDGRRLRRVDIERDYYRNTHLVLGRRPFPYGVPPNTPAGAPEQPFPQQVVRHLANVLRDAKKIAGAREQVSHYYAFTLGWFSHVVSDAIFKGVYPESVRVRFFGHQYHMSMLPAAEALTMTDISHDFGVHWPSWHGQLLKDEPDGGALRHLAMGNPSELYDQEYWTPEFGKPDPAIGRVLDALRPVNRTWFHRMYLTPDYSAPTPLLDKRKMEERASWKFNGRDLGQIRAYAIRSGWYDAFIRGVGIYLRVVEEATELAGIQKSPMIGLERGKGLRNQPGVVDWSLWCEIVQEPMHAPDHPDSWGSRLEVEENAVAALENLAGQNVRFLLPAPATDYQKKIVESLQSVWEMKPGGERKIVIGPPAFHQQPLPALCREDILRSKYGPGWAGLIAYNEETSTLHLAGLSDFGDLQLLNWLRERSL